MTATTAQFNRHGTVDPHGYAASIAIADPGDGLTRTATIAVALEVPVWRGVEVTAEGSRWQIVHVNDRHSLGLREILAVELGA
jgi:hypothetical protein